MDPVLALINFLRAVGLETGLLTITCQREYSPPRVAFVTVGSIEIDVNYDQYQQIREALGLPDDVCGR